MSGPGVHRYLEVVRKLQRVYGLEPAGSHGVWGLDDYQFMPFIWGSAQLIGAVPAAVAQAQTHARALTIPRSVVAWAVGAQTTPCSSPSRQPPRRRPRRSATTISTWPPSTLSFRCHPTPASHARPFITLMPTCALRRRHPWQMKRGPFHEHSPILYDITAVASWAKVNSGLHKMYVAEVLKKFPIVQHFLFGSLLQLVPSTNPNPLLVQP